jgi:addiction module HigA family antidote
MWKFVIIIDPEGAPDMKKLPPIHPGEILWEEFMKPLGLSQNALARNLGVDAKAVNKIVHGKRSITAIMALRLARYFRTSPGFWMNLQVRYDLETAKDAADADILRSVKPRPMDLPSGAAHNFSQ